MRKELLIFGSEGGLGKGITKVMLEKDFDKIYLFDLNFSELHSDERLTKIVVNDLSIEKNVIAALSNVKPDKSTIFFLYSTIGGFYGGQTVWEIEIEDWERILKLNLTTNFLIAKHFSWIVKMSAAGSICFTAAYTAEHPEEMKAIYGASKSALVHLIKTLSLEGKKINLSANGISPYIIDTEANRKWMPEADFNRWIKPEEIGEVVYLIFKNFNYVSGNVLTLKEKFSY